MLFTRFSSQKILNAVAVFFTIFIQFIVKFIHKQSLGFCNKSVLWVSCIWSNLCEYSPTRHGILQPTRNFILYFICGAFQKFESIHPDWIKNLLYIKIFMVYSKRFFMAWLWNRLISSEFNTVLSHTKKIMYSIVLQTIFYQYWNEKSKN